MIEAKILEVSLTDDMEFGVDWSKILGDLNIRTGGFSRATMPTEGPVNPVPSGGIGIFSNLITAVGSNYQFATALDALQNKTKVDTLSTPKVFAIHGKSAKVQVGGQQGYRVTTTNLGVATETIEFIDTGTVLELTPFIDDDGNILMEVLPSITDAELDEGIPVTKTTAVSTWLMAKDGQTIFIGGLIQDKKEKTRNMIPCLGSIDGIGALFGKTKTDLKKRELIFLITPRIFEGMPTRADLDAINKANKMEEMFSKEPLPVDKQIRDFIAPMK
jgi:type II secretory pathway component GspD/PulD (secretin)